MARFVHRRFRHVLTRFERCGAAGKASNGDGCLGKRVGGQAVSLQVNETSIFRPCLRRPVAWRCNRRQHAGELKEEK